MTRHPSEEPSIPLPVLNGFVQLLAHHPDPAWIHDLETLRFVAVNDALAGHTGYTRAELLEMTLKELLAPEEAERMEETAAQAQAETSTGPLKGTWKLATRDGRTLVIETSAHTLEMQGRRCRFVIARARPEPKEPAKGTAPGSSFTVDIGLPDRAALLDHLKSRIAQKGGPFAILIFNIDRFRHVNRTLGLESGDYLLTAVAKRLQASIQSGEMVAHLGNDEFGLSLEGVGQPEAALHMAREIQEALEEPFTINGQEVKLTASVGIALSRPDHRKADEFLREAEVALQDAQVQGIGSRRVFAADIGARAARARRMETELRPGLERGDLKVRFQPIISLKTGMVAGFEALARWEHPELGLIMPNMFIPMAERTGLIVDLGQRVLRDACRQMVQWHSRFRDAPPLFLTVNCSAAQFFDPKLAQIVKWALSDSGLRPASLKLELTESVVMEDNPRTVRPFDRILELGVQMIIDDFGTGFSSLSRLHQLPIEALKIDRTFVEGIPERLDSHSLIRAIVQLARNFALKVTAEGIENVEQLRALRGMDCDYAQGFYFAKALDPKQAEDLIAAGQKW